MTEKYGSDVTSNSSGFDIEEERERKLSTIEEIMGMMDMIAGLDEKTQMAVLEFLKKKIADSKDEETRRRLIAKNPTLLNWGKRAIGKAMGRGRGRKGRRRLPLIKRGI